MKPNPLKPISITKRAADEIKIIMQSDEIPNDYVLRIGVKEGGCGSGEDGFTIGFDSKKDSDLEYNYHGVVILVDKKHVMHLLGKQVSYKEDGDEWGFVFESADDNKG